MSDRHFEIVTDEKEARHGTIKISDECYGYVTKVDEHFVHYDLHQIIDTEPRGGKDQWRARKKTAETKVQLEDEFRDKKQRDQLNTILGKTMLNSTLTPVQRLARSIYYERQNLRIEVVAQIHALSEKDVLALYDYYVEYHWITGP